MGIEAMLAGRRSAIPGLSNKASAFGGRYVPRTLLLPLVRRLGGDRLAEASTVTNPDDA